MKDRTHTQETKRVNDALKALEAIADQFKEIVREETG